MSCAKRTRVCRVGVRLAPVGPIKVRFAQGRKRYVAVAIGATLLLPLHQPLAGDLAVATIQLPVLRINGQPARAHTQGLEIHSGRYYVAARREDAVPKRALLLRTDTRRADWDVWDLTPLDAHGGLTALDHPGGMQSDGERLWIPLAESRQKGRSLIRTFALAGMVPGQPLKAGFEFSVNDHIGAVAVSANQKKVFGANWDTQTVYVWDFDGYLQQTLTGSDLERRGLGVGSAANRHAGLAVQDWKADGNRLMASGLFRGNGNSPETPQSRWMSFLGFGESGIQCWSVTLPKQSGTELAGKRWQFPQGWFISFRTTSAIPIGFFKCPSQTS